MASVTLCCVASKTNESLCLELCTTYQSKRPEHTSARAVNQVGQCQHGIDETDHGNNTIEDVPATLDVAARL